MSKPFNSSSKVPPLVERLETNQPLFSDCWQGWFGKANVDQDTHDNRMHTFIARHFWIKETYWSSKISQISPRNLGRPCASYPIPFIPRDNEFGTILFGPRRVESEFWQPWHVILWRDLKKAFDTLLEDNLGRVVDFPRRSPWWTSFFRPIRQLWLLRRRQFYSREKWWLMVTTRLESCSKLLISPQIWNFVPPAGPCFDSRINLRNFPTFS